MIFCLYRRYSPPYKKASKTSDKEMFRVYNMGHRMEIYCLPEAAPRIISTAESFGISAKIIGRTEASNLKNESNHLTIHHQNKTLEYSIEK